MLNCSDKTLNECLNYPNIVFVYFIDTHVKRFWNVHNILVEVLVLLITAWSRASVAPGKWRCLVLDVLGLCLLKHKNTSWDNRRICLEHSVQRHMIVSVLLYVVWLSRDVTSQGTAVGTELQWPWVSFFFFLSIPFLLAAMWLNQIQLAVVKLSMGSGVEFQPQKHLVII